MVAKTDRYKKQGKDLLQRLVKKTANSLYGGNIGRDVNDQYKCLIENWIRENYDIRVKGLWPMKNGNFIVQLENDKVVDDQDMAKMTIQIPCHLGRYKLGLFKRFLNIFICEINGFLQ